MAKTFEAKYYLGSITDSYNSVETNNNSTLLVKTSKGYALSLNGSNTWVSYAGTRNVKSVVIWLKANALSKDIIDFNGGTNSIEVGASNITATGFVSPIIYLDNIVTPTLTTNVWKCLIVTTNTSFSSTALKIGRETSYFNGNIACVKLYDTVLTQKQIEAEQKEFVNAKPILKPKRGFMLNKSSDLSSKKNNGLIAAYNMKPINNVLVDISGNSKNGAITGMVNANKGLHSPGPNTKASISLTTPPLIGSSVWTIIYKFKNYTPINGYEPFIDLGTNRYICFSNASTVGVGFISYRGVETLTTFYTFAAISNDVKNSEVDLIFVSNGTTISLYINGVFNSLVTPLNTILPVGVRNLIKGYNVDSTVTPKLDIIDVKLYNRVLTLQEIKAYHNSFVIPYIIEDFNNTPADGSNVVPNGWVKGTGNYKVGEFVKKYEEQITNGNFNSATGWTLHTNSVINGNVLTITPNNTTVYASNLLLSPNTLGKRVKLSYTIISNTTGSTNGLRIGNLSANSILGSTSKVLDISIGVHYEELVILGTINTVLDFYTQLNVGGTIVIDNVSLTEINPLPTFKQNTKYLQCTTAGTIVIPSKQAYGTIEFDLFKGADANSTTISFIADKIIGDTLTIGYRLTINNAESILIYRNVSLLTQTASAYITNNTWYRIKITRTLLGVLTTYIKGGAFGNNWVLVNTTGGTGTNPVTDNTYTASNYFVLDLDVNDRFTNLVMYDGIKQ